MFADSESSTHSLTPTSSFIDDSILDDPQPHPEEQTSPDSAVFEKKWIVTDVGSSGSEINGIENGIEKNGVLIDPNLDSSFESMEDWEDESPYPEVRAAVSNTDDMEMAADTLRAWTIGLFGAIIIPGLNNFSSFDIPAPRLLVAQLVSFPLACAWARSVPAVKIFGVSLNPGPFSLKEHVIITVMATVGSSSAYATDIIAVQRKFYGQNWSFGYQWLLVMSTQLIGFSMGGVVKRFLVSPPSMIWPANLVTCALFNTLHSQVYPGFRDSGMSRQRFFFLGFLGSCFWCMCAPTFLPFLPVNQLFGYTSGLGMSIITFDWNNIAFIGSPGWAEANVTIGFVFFFWIVTPIIYYTNTWYSTFTPILSSNMYDNTGAHYNVSRILGPHGKLDEQAYKSYSPLFLSASFAVAYGMSFASITATLVHSVLYFRKQIWLQARRSLGEQPDVHARLMARYPQVPEWWYFSVLIIVFAMSAITIEIWPTEVPIWGLLLALSIAAFYIVPTGMIQAITNQQVGLNVISELVAGYAFPGKPLPMMIFKTFGYITMSQALQFASDMKLGHYMKVPPRSMFWCQVVATIVAGTVQLAVQEWMFANVTDICEQHQADHFVCANTGVFFVASVVWGVIGPSRQFSQGQIYHGLTCFFLIGAIAPIVAWLINKRWPSSFFKYVNVPVVLAGTGWIPPATAVNYIPWAVVGFIFNYVIRRRHFNWWAKYNYVLSAALDCGTAVGTLLVFFALQYPLRGNIGKNTIEKWWGNTVYMKTADQKTLPLQKVVAGEIFGSVLPQSWRQRRRR
ncbi:OPT oligopeptide transporter [Lactifluus volemus]|nr:OPT oligopeptide transporter [Lactifluus volemus]